MEASVAIDTTAIDKYVLSDVLQNGGATFRTRNTHGDRYRG
jgi:hypothetical protein